MYSNPPPHGTLAYFNSFQLFTKIPDYSIDVAVGYGLDGRFSIPGKGNLFFSTPQDPHTLWGHPVSRKIGAERVFFFMVVKFTTYFSLAPRSRIVELHLHSHIHLRGVLLN
jgi:hypothetical protein